MKVIYEDLIDFFQSLSFSDILFFASILVLLILIVVLIYVIRINNENDSDNDLLEENKKEEDKTGDDELDLANISKLLSEEEPKPILLNNYEKEQEAKAIISYDELINSQQPEEVNYKKEEDIAGLKIKAVDNENVTKHVELPKMKNKVVTDNIYNAKEVVLISYEKEEAFLEALKKLQKTLN